MIEFKKMKRNPHRQIQFANDFLKPDIVAQAYNSITWKAEEGETSV
jgi:hypothetical protein